MELVSFGPFVADATFKNQRRLLGRIAQNSKTDGERALEELNWTWTIHSLKVGLVNLGPF